MNRRIFLQSLVSVSACGAIADKGVSVTYAYIASVGPAVRGHIDVFRMEGQRRTHLQQVPCHAPASLVLHPNGQFLYAANEVSLHEGLPRGTVEVFSIDQRTGKLSSVERRALSLSATQPRSLAIRPDARYLVVAAFGGGAFNVLPIHQNGSLGGVSGIFKDLGRGPHTEHQLAAHPHTVVFDIAGRFVLASDLGCDRLSVFALSGEGQLQRKSKISIAAGAGPGPMVVHPGGSLLYVLHQLKPAISCHRYRQTEGIIEPHFQQIALSNCATGLSIDSNGRFLHAAFEKGETILAIHPVSGSLS